MPRKRSSDRNVPFASNPLLRVKLPAYRSQIMMLFVAIAFVALAARAVWLQVFSQDFLQKQGESRYARTIELPASRGKIFDRNGIVLASSLPARAVWAVPEQVEATPQQLTQLARLLDVNERELRRKLADEDRSFVYLKRQVDAGQAERIAALQLPGIHMQREYKRYYPEGETVAHIVGFTNVEDVGQEGIELAKNPMLAGKAGSRRVIKDRLGRVIEDVEAVREPHHGSDLALDVNHAAVCMRRFANEVFEPPLPTAQPGASIWEDLMVALRAMLAACGQDSELWAAEVNLDAAPELVRKLRATVYAIERLCGHFERVH